jgi:hypothetical protein
MNLVLCFLCNPQAKEFALVMEGRATNHHAFHGQSSQLLKLLSGSMSDPLPLHNHLSWPSPSLTDTVAWYPKIFWVANCSLFSSPLPPTAQTGAVGPLSRRHLVIALWDVGSERLCFLSDANLSHQGSHCPTKSMHWIYGLWEGWACPTARAASLLPRPPSLPCSGGFCFPSPQWS